MIVCHIVCRRKVTADISELKVILSGKDSLHIGAEGGQGKGCFSSGHMGGRPYFVRGCFQKAVGNSPAYGFLGKIGNAAGIGISGVGTDFCYSSGVFLEKRWKKQEACSLVTFWLGEKVVAVVPATIP